MQRYVEVLAAVAVTIDTAQYRGSGYFKFVFSM
jgi:hypothetical protein